MAEITKIMGLNEINVSNSVGKGGVNDRADVVVVQALMKYALEGKSHFKGDIFEINGVMSKRTLQLIKKYQRYLRTERDVSVSVDGRIDSANGIFVRKGRKLTWTIGQLNGEALEMYLLTNKGGGRDYIQAIRNLYPQVDLALKGGYKISFQDMLITSYGTKSTAF